MEIHSLCRADPILLGSRAYQKSLCFARCFGFSTTLVPCVLSIAQHRCVCDAFWWYVLANGFLPEVLTCGFRRVMFKFSFLMFYFAVAFPIVVIKLLITA